LRLLHFEKFVGNDHGVVNVSLVATLHVEEGVLEGYSNRIISVPICFSTDGARVVPRLLRLLVSDVLLAAVAWRLLLTRLQVEPQVRRGPLPRRLHAHLLRLTHCIVFARLHDLGLLRELWLLAARRLRLVIRLVNAHHFAVAVADVVAAMERYLFRRGL